MGRAGGGMWRGGRGGRFCLGDEGGDGDGGGSDALRGVGLHYRFLFFFPLFFLVRWRVGIDFGIRGKGAWDWFCYVFTLFFLPFVGGLNLYSSVLFFSLARKHGLSLPLERIFCSFLHMEAVPTKACRTENP